MKYYRLSSHRARNGRRPRGIRSFIISARATDATASGIITRVQPEGIFGDAPDQIPPRHHPPVVLGPDVVRLPVDVLVGGVGELGEGYLDPSFTHLVGNLCGVVLVLAEGGGNGGREEEGGGVRRAKLLNGSAMGLHVLHRAKAMGPAGQSTYRYNGVAIGIGILIRGWRQEHCSIEYTILQGSPVGVWMQSSRG